MQQYYTLEEAAGRLLMSPDELREMAKTKKVRAFQDRGTWRFRSQDIDELARTRGVGSGPDLRLADSGKTKKPKPADDDAALSFDLDDSKSPGPKSSRSSKSPKPRPGSDSDVRLDLDNRDFEIESDSGKARPEKSPKPGPRKSKMQRPTDSGVRMAPDAPSDSDVKVVPAATDSDVKPRPGGKSPSDSDIRLHEQTRGKKKKAEASVTEELIDLDEEEKKLAKSNPPSGTRPRMSPASPGSNPAQPVLPTTSPFEISEPDFSLDEKKPAARPKGKKPAPRPRQEQDSASDFELIPFDASKSPNDLGSGEIPLLDDDEVALGGEVGAGPGNSGINLQDPADSGISLESDGSDEMEFELTLDSGTTPKPSSGGVPVVQDDDSSSEFELSLEDGGSDAEDSSSEFELSLDDSGDMVGLSDDSSSESESEFELTLDDEGGLAVDDESKDIFEPTNFDVPALDDESQSEAVDDGSSDTDLDGSGSDFEISLDEDSDPSGSESQVVALDEDEEADPAGATLARPRKAASKSKAAARAVVEDDSAMELDIDLNEDEPAAKKTKKKKPAAAVVDDDEEDEDEDSQQELAAAAAPADWGALPAILLIPTVVVLFLVSFMGFELVQGMFGYSRPGARTSKLLIDPIARPIAEAMDAKLPD